MSEWREDEEQSAVERLSLFAGAIQRVVSTLHAIHHETLVASECRVTKAELIGALREIRRLAGTVE